MAPGVLILTPVKEAAHHLDRYLAGLDRLTYPRAALSLALLESDSRDGTFEMLSARLPRLRARFRRVTLLQHDFDFHMPPGVPRWAAPHQLQRRSVLARSRTSPPVLEEIAQRPSRDPRTLLARGIALLEES